MFVCCECCQVEVFATSWSLVQRSPTDCNESLCVWSRNLKNEEAMTRVRSKRHSKKKTHCVLTISAAYNTPTRFDVYRSSSGSLLLCTVRVQN